MRRRMKMRKRRIAEERRRRHSRPRPGRPWSVSCCRWHRCCAVGC